MVVLGGLLLVALLAGLLNEDTRMVMLCALGICAALCGIGGLLIVTAPPPPPSGQTEWFSPQGNWGFAACLLSILSLGVIGLLVVVFLLVRQVMRWIPSQQ